MNDTPGQNGRKDEDKVWKCLPKLSREEPMMMGDPKMMVKIKRMIVVG